MKKHLSVEGVEALIEDMKESGDMRKDHDGIEYWMDDEVAHSCEDAIHQAVLRAIADGAPNAKELAEAALKTLRFTFARWCA